jgi:mRNA interferase RelE/StbE
MEIGYSIVLHSDVIAIDLPRLDTFWRQEIRNAVRGKVATQPDLYGKPLRQPLKGYRKIRVGDYRVIFQIKKRTAQIVIIGHRSEVYAHLLKRLRV